MRSRQGFSFIHSFLSGLFLGLSLDPLVFYQIFLRLSIVLFICILIFFGSR